MKRRRFSKNETYDHFFFPLKKSKRRRFITHFNRMLTDLTDLTDRLLTALTDRLLTALPTKPTAY
jgi:hypothetical protein